MSTEKKKIRERLLERVAYIACNYPKSVVFIAIILTALAFVPILRTGYTSAFNISRMLPQDIPASRAFTRAITDFGTADEALIVFKLNKDNPSALNITGKLADKICKRLGFNPDIRSSFSRLLTKEEKNQLLYVELPKHGMLLLPKEDIRAIKKKLEKKNIFKSVNSTARKLIQGDASEELQEQIIINTLGLGSIFKDSFENIYSTKDKEETADILIQKKFDNKEGYILSPNQEILLLIAEPLYAAQSIPFASRIMREIENTTFDIIIGTSEFRFEDSENWQDFFKSFLAAAESNDLPGYKALFNAITPSGQNSIRLLASTSSLTELDTPQKMKSNINTALTGLNSALRKRDTYNEWSSSDKNLYIQQADKEITRLQGLNYPPEITERSAMLYAGRKLLEEAFKGKLIPLKANQGLPPAALKAFHLEFAGGYQIARTYGQKINGVMIGTLIISGICVLAFFGYCFRRYGVLLYIGIPLVMIICWTAGIGWLLFGQLNIVSCAFAAVLIGLGIDYAVHIYNRYIEERAKGIALDQSFKVAICHTGWGIIVGMITTCLAFFSLNVTRFTQLSEFGALGGIGIFLSAPAMMFVMPALITIRSNIKDSNKRLFKTSAFFLPQTAKIVQNHRKGVFILTIILCIISIGAILTPGSISFNASMAALRPKDRAFEINGEVAASFANRNPNKLTFMVIGETEEDALEKMSNFEEKFKLLEESGLINGYESVTRYLPSPSTQRERLKEIAKIDFPAAINNFSAALQKAEMDEDYFSFNFNLLNQHYKMIEEKRIILPADLANTKISRLINTYVAKRQKTYYIYDNDMPKSYPVTLAKAATQFEDNAERYPAGAVLSKKDVENLNPLEQHPSLRVKSITVYEGGYAVKATIFPPIPEGTTTGEPVITPEWLQKVAKILGLAPEQFEAKPNLTDFQATLTGASVATSILAKIVKEDFLIISIWIVAICFGVVNLFYHKNMLQSVLCTLPLLILMILKESLLIRYPALNHYFWIPVTILSLLFFFGAILHKNISRTFYCFLPVSLGLLFLFGTMSILNIIGNILGVGHIIDLNFVNVLTIPIIIGVGVDNGIHLVNRYFEDGREIKSMIIDTGRALAITALTSMVGFGSLYWAKFQGLDSIAQLGVLSVIALFTVLLSSVLFFPSILATLSPRKKTKK